MIKLIKKILREAGWAVQDKSKVDFSERKRIAVRVYQTDTGFTDYVLFVNHTPMGVNKAKNKKMRLSKMICYFKQSVPMEI